MKVPVQKYLLEKPAHILTLIPFNSGRKRACTVIRHPSDQNLVRVFSKGAPEIVLKYVTSYFNKEGEVVEMTREKSEEIIKKIIKDSFAKKALRTLLIAYRDYTWQEFVRL
jgi:magnesium-transporting ATPase (P-type)